MKLVQLGCLLLALAPDALAHRLDEYLQAARVSVATNRIDLAMGLTPGVAIVDQLLAIIDKDRDEKISKKEADAYAQTFLKDIRIELNEKVLVLNLVEISFPTLLDVRGGLGIIRLKATASVEPLVAGKHNLSLTNAHLPAISVYLVNALTPKDPAIQITKQTRDELQKHYRLEFNVTPASR